MPIITVLSFALQIFAILQPSFRTVKIDSKRDGVRLVETE